MFKINGVLQHFDWGDAAAIADLRGVEASGRPEAEFWFGVHPKGASRLAGTEGYPSVDPAGDSPELGGVIAADPLTHLGPATSERFGQLPFLLKLLAAARPLSIQAHPDRGQAVAGFEREESLGIDRSAPNRNYRDPNHKPELICALTRFEAKCGFRPLVDTRRLLALFTDPRIQPLQSRLKADTNSGSDPAAIDTAVLIDTVRWLLTSEADEASNLIDGLTADCARLLRETEPHPGPEMSGFEAELRWTLAIADDFPGDPGVAVALLLNHVVLEPGEALFLEAGVLHSYLQGFAVEVMASSDNVLRGGLTQKHVDVDELLDVVRYEARRPAIQRPNGAEHRYDVPVPDFGLRRYRYRPGRESAAGDPRPDSAQPARGAVRCRLNGPEMVLATGGGTELSAGGESLALSSGEVAFIPFAHGVYTLRPTRTDSVAWRVGIGQI